MLSPDAPSGDARQQLILDQAYLVDQIIGGLILRRPELRDLADDLKGEAHIALVEAVDSHDPARASLATHCATRIRYAVCEALRREFGKTVDPSELELLSADCREAQAALVAPDDIASIDARLTIEALLPHLTPAQRQAIELTQLQGLTQAEAAARMKITQPAVSKLLRLALAHLRCLANTNAA